MSDATTGNLIGACPKCGNWHTNPYFCPADLSNRGASEPLRDWRDAELERLRARLAEAEALLRDIADDLAIGAHPQFYKDRICAFLERQP